MIGGLIFQLFVLSLVVLCLNLIFLQNKQTTTTNSKAGLVHQVTFYVETDHVLSQVVLCPDLTHLQKNQQKTKTNKKTTTNKQTNKQQQQQQQQQTAKLVWCTKSHLLLLMLKLTMNEKGSGGPQ